MNKQHPNEKDCPNCGQPMAWKNLEKNRCLRCEPFPQDNPSQAIINPAISAELLSENLKLRQRITELEQSKSGHAEKISSLQIDLVKSSSQILEMASCLAECLDDINQAINATMRSGNGGKLWVDGRELSTHQVADRLEILMIKRDRILKALHPLREHKQCTYPSCNCPFDKGQDDPCLKNLPLNRK